MEGFVHSDLKALSTWSRRSFAQQGEDLVLFRLLRRQCGLPLGHKGFYVDLGAFHPVKDSTTKLLYDRGWRGINLDIQEESVRAFQEFRPDDVSVWGAVGDCDGEVDVYVPESGISVHSAADPAVKDAMAKAGVCMRRLSVPAYSFNTLMERHAQGRPIDYVDIDVQGEEMKALRGIDFARYRPKCFGIEIVARDIQTGLKSEVARFMRENGYRCVASTIITYFFVT